MRKQLFLVIATLACSAGEVTRSKPPATGTGTIHFELIRNSTGSQIPSASDSVLVRAVSDSANVVVRAALPNPGQSVPVEMDVPAGDGYTVMVLAFHGHTMDAGGETDSASVSVQSNRLPGQEDVATHVTINVQPFTSDMLQISELENPAQIGTPMQISVSFLEYLAMPLFFSDQLGCPWGCPELLNGTSSIAGYQNPYPDVPSPWLVSATAFPAPGWGADDLTLTSDTISVTLTPAEGTIIVSFDKAKHRQP